MSFRDLIEDDLAKTLAERLFERAGKFERVWLDESLYGFSLNNEHLKDESLVFECGHATYLDKLLDFDKEQINEWLNKQCEKIEEHCVEKINSMQRPNVGFKEESISVSVSHRYIKVIFKYKTGSGAWSPN